MADTQERKLDTYIRAARSVLYDARGSRERGPAVLPAVRKYCLNCHGNSRKGVRSCPSRDCPLFPFRSGYRPATAAAKGWDVETTTKESDE